MPIEPSTPLFFEFDAGNDFVAGLKGWRQTRFKGALAQEAAGERMESADIRLIQIGDALATTAALDFGTCIVDRCLLKVRPDSVSQFGGGSFREGDRGDAVQGRRSGGDQVGDPLNQAGRFTSAGAGLHEKRRTQIISDGLSGIVIDRNEACVPVVRSRRLR